MFCNTFLEMSLKKWRLRLRNCGRAVCFDPHFFSVQLNSAFENSPTLVSLSCLLLHSSNSSLQPSTTKHQIQYQSKFIGQKIQGKFIEFLTFGILLLHITMTFEIKFIWLLLFLLINISSIKGKTSHYCQFV